MFPPPSQVCWCADYEFYQGTVTAFSKDTGKHTVRLGVCCWVVECDWRGRCCMHGVHGVQPWRARLNVGGALAPYALLLSSQLAQQEVAPGATAAGMAGNAYLKTCWVGLIPSHPTCAHLAPKRSTHHTSHKKHPTVHNAPHPPPNPDCAPNCRFSTVRATRRSCTCRWSCCRLTRSNRAQRPPTRPPWPRSRPRPPRSRRSLCWRTRAAASSGPGGCLSSRMRGRAEGPAGPHSASSSRQPQRR